MIKKLVISFLISIILIIYLHFRIWPTYPILNFLANTYNNFIIPSKTKKLKKTIIIFINVLTSKKEKIKYYLKL